MKKEVDITTEYESRIQQLHDENFALQRKVEELKRKAWLNEQRAVREKKQLGKRMKEVAQTSFLLKIVFELETKLAEREPLLNDLEKVTKC